MSPRHKHPGWIPDQHGAWAMLVVPTIVGMALRARADGLPGWAWPLAGTWLFGYFCFHALSLWLKAAPRKRVRYRTPLRAWMAVAAVFGLLTLVLGPWTLLWWIPVFAPLLGLALWLAHKRRDRSLASGMATVLAAMLMLPILRFTTPGAAWTALSDGHRDALVALALFGYFGGTVPYVKTMIRERGHLNWLLGSIGWHAVATVLAAVGAALGPLGWGWTAFFALTTVRAWLVPTLGPGRGRTISPMQVGLLEIVFSIAAVVLSLV